MKVAFVGAGSYVFGPSMLVQAIPENRMDGVDLALIDPNRDAIEMMAAIGRQLAQQEGVDLSVSSHTDFESGVDGADFVICSAAVQMNSRFRIDRDIIREEYPQHLISEFGGVHGASYSLRQIRLIRSLTEVMRRKCPNAWLLDISNPLPRVCQAAHEDGIKTVGFCSVSISGFGRLWDLFHGEWDQFPFEKSQNAFKVEIGGTNHLSWLVELNDAASGVDLMPKLREIVAKRDHRSRCEAYARKTGYLLMSGDDHVQDFLPPDGSERSLEVSSHGDDAARVERKALLHQVSRGEASYKDLLDTYSWERPMDLIEALRGGKPASFTSLNLIDDGQVPQLPCTAFVETACTADSNGIHPDTLDLPASVVPYAENAVQVTAKLVEAAQQRSLSLLDEALDLDPTVVDKPKGKAALRRCVVAHEDIVGTYS